MKNKFHFFKQQGRWLLTTLTLLFTLALGNAWAEESATNNPATVSYGTGSAAKTFLDVANTVSNATIKTGSVACVTYGLYEMDKNWKPAFYTGPANGSSSSADLSGAADNGFLAGSSAGSGTAANKSATSGYGLAKYKSDAAATIYVTGITGIAVMGKDADTKNEKRLYIKVEEYAKDGTCTAVGTGDGITKSSYNKSLHITTYDAGTLSGTKYYKVTLYAGYSTNHETSQIRFTKYIAPSCDDANASIIENTSTYVGDDLDLEFSSDNTNTVSYSIKKGGSATSDASVTGGVFNATVAGTYVVTATQAKDASNHCAVEESVTITVNPKTPVASVNVAGAAAGYKGMVATFTATAQYAAEYEWYVDGTKQGSDSAKLLFTPSEAKTYSIVCKARNDFNETGEWIASSAHSYAVTSLYGELVRATLTGGNNATMTGIVGGTFDSNLSSGKYKLDKNVYMGVQLASGAFQEGDTVIIKMTTAGSNYPCLFADKDRNTVLYVATATSSDLTYKIVLPAAVNNKNTVYLSRDNDVTYKWNPVVEYISVVRPMPVKSTAEALVGASFNGTALTSAQVATLLANQTLALSEALADAPTAVFTKQVTYTYEDDSQKQVNVDVDAVVTVASTNWQAKATINSIDYTITTPKASSAKVYYYDGATKLGEEVVALNGNPADYADFQSKQLASFVGWYSKSDLSGDPVNIASAVITKDTTFYASFTNRYATSVNIEKLVMQNGKSYGLMAQMGAQNYASNITGSLDSLSVKADSLRNYSYLGLKVKQSGGMLDFRLKKDKTVKIKFGNVATPPHVKINGGDYAEMTITDKVYSYTAEADAYISIKMMSGDAVVFQQIMIGEDIQAPELYPINYADAENGSVSGLKLGIPGETIKVYPTPASGYIVESVTVNEAAITPAENVYSFTMPSAAANVVATFGVYVPPTFTVTYKANGGTGDDVVVDDATVVADNMFTAPASAIFAGWKDADDNDVAVGAAVTENLTLFAQWRSYFTITYMDGETQLDTEDVFEGDAPVGIADPVKAMNIFKGWTLAGSDEVIDVTTLTASTTVYAKWEAIDACYYFAAKSVTESEAISADDEINTTYGGTLVAKTDNISYETLGVLVASSGNTYVTANLDYAMTEGTKITVVLVSQSSGSNRGVNLCEEGKKTPAIQGMTWNPSAAGEEKEFTYTLDANSALKDKKAFSLYRTANTYIKSIIVKDCAPEQYTVTYKDGTTELGTEQVYENAHPTAAGINTYKKGYELQGWSLTNGGDVVELTDVTITEDKTLYAKYAVRDCSGMGVKFSMAVDPDKAPASNLYYPETTPAVGDLAVYATVSGGLAQAVNTNTSSTTKNFEVNKEPYFKLTGNGSHMRILLDCPLAENDTIKFVKNQKIVLSFDSLKTKKEDIASSTSFYIVPAKYAGEDTLHIWYDGSAVQVNGVQVIRPEIYAVSFNLMGHGSAIADLTGVIKGSKITAPTAPTDENFAFAGWYKENTLENEWDFANDVVSAATTLYAKWLDKSDATLKSLKYGETAIELQAGIYEYNVELPALTTAVPALTAVANSPLAAAVATDADAFDGEGHATSIVTVTPAVGAAQIYTVNFSKAAALPQVNVTEATTWDWSLAGSTSMENQHNVVLANVPGITNDNTFNSQALKGTFNKLAVGYFQGSVLSFTTEVDGKLTITFRGTNNNTRHMQVCVGDGETVVADWTYQGSGPSAQQTKSIYVPVGKVTLKAFEGENAQNVRIYNMELSTSDNYHRTVNPSYLGTLCWTNKAVLGGATLYEFAGKNENNYLVFDEVAENRLEAGKPYIFMPENGNTQIKVYNTDNEPAKTESDLQPVNHMYGTFTGKTLVPGVDDNMYYFSSNHIWAVKDFNVNIPVPAYYCYVDYQAVLAGDPAPAAAPGRRRVTMGVQGEQVATGVEQIADDQLPVKVLINGQLFILRGEKMFNVNGQLVK